MNIVIAGLLLGIGLFLYVKILKMDKSG